MHRLNPPCCLRPPRPPRPPLGLLHPASPAAASLSLHEEQEEEEEKEEHPAACCYNTGRDDVSGQAADAQRVSSRPPGLSGTPRCSGPARGGAAPSSELTNAAIGAEGGDESRRFAGGRYRGGPGPDTRGCVCVYGQREPEGPGPCWPGSPYVYYGVRRNLVVGVEVVEEVAVEDTLEVIMEDIYADDLLDPELLQDVHLYPT